MTELLYKAPVLAILDDVNAKNNKTLYTPVTTDNVYITDVFTVSEETGESKFTIVSREGNDDYLSGTFATLNYKRYLTSVLFKYPVTIDAINGETYRALLERFTSKLNIPDFVYESDVVDEDESFDIDKSTEEMVFNSEEETASTIDITFASQSPGYIGKVSLYVKNTTKNLGAVVTNVDLDVLVYPGEGADGTKTNLNVFTSPVFMDGGRISVTADEDHPLTKVGTVFTSSDSTLKSIMTGYISNIGSAYRGIPSQDMDSIKIEITGLLEGATIVETDLVVKGPAYDDCNIVIRPATTSDMFEGDIIVKKIVYSAPV